MSKIETSVKKQIAKHFFDFFMLFLAVTLGFFVDNFRDNYSGRKTATELAGDLVQDISGDTVSIHLLLNRCEIKANKLDSLYLLIEDNKTNFNDSLIYYYSAFVALRPWFERNSVTFQQLTNSGYLSYFTKDASTALTRYDISCVKTIAYLENERSVITERIYPFQQEIFHIENFNPLINGEGLITKPELRNWNSNTIWQYHNYITQEKNMNRNIRNQYKKLLLEARSTLKVLKKEYNIKT